MPLSVLAYLVYGTSMHDSVIYSIQTSWLQLCANLMIAMHCILTLVIVINPLNQEIEHYLKVSHSKLHLKTIPNFEESAFCQ